MSSQRRHLIAAPPGGPALGPEQRRFNRLLEKIDKARALLQAWDEQGQLFAVAHAARVAPLQGELLDCQARLVRRLEALLGERQARWTQAERRRLREELCELGAGLIDAAEDEALGAEMRALFRRHAGHGYDEEKADEMAAMKEMFERFSGLDLGEQAFASEHDLLHAAQRSLEAEHARAGERRAGRRPTPAERRRERERAEASKSLREVYRKLAAALHPDRAENDADRKRRDALMPRVNQAYEAGDLLALFALQLEIEQVDAAHLARASAERARQYNRLLADQLQQIEAEIEGRRLGLCFEHDLDPARPLAPARLGALLEQMVREHRADLVQAQRDLAQLDDPVRARACMRARWREVDRDALPF